MNYRFLFLSFFLLFSCSKSEMYPSNVQAFGHGGLGIGSTYPMNSFESLLASLKLGASGTEIDVQMTKDGVLVAYHDETLTSSTNFTGIVNDYTWEELQHAYYTANPYLNYKLCSLDEFFSNVPNLHDYQFIFDTKMFHNDPDFKEYYTKAILEIIDAYGLENNVMIESKDVDFLQAFQSTGLRLIYYTHNFSEGLEIVLAENYFGIAIEHTKITKKEVSECHSKNIKVTTFNVHTKKQNKEVVRKGIDYIQTNKVKHLVGLLS